MKGVFSNAYSSGSITESSIFYLTSGAVLPSSPPVLLSDSLPSSSSTSFKSLALPSSYSLSSFFLLFEADFEEDYFEPVGDYDSSASNY